ncbi:MAG: hypothetical protein KY476_22805 [Planctomycetes bacterium]|nr:hypothetical protein [Planctomycetota bacterium]
MAFNLRLPDALRKARWKVKIRDKELREPPHVTIIRGTDAWRLGLRDGAFLDRRPDPSAIPDSLMELIEERETWNLLCDEWDRLYPANPVAGVDAEPPEVD